ncbi:glycoside hydrolase family 15 protein [Mucilaginibacter limnophilus]|uniref:glycoside hydrolase family 15 protein n=1 Tax=Mucilaginibacter limnophilus TaxID=1932778 RepID=UPI00197B1620|nr:trehalase-like domain-containing protein [Mucilaginibacter limnophilus]
MSYQPIENYAIIGDLNTVALVGQNGSIDFMCFPDFDSPTLFAALLDDRKGGSFSLSPESTGTKHKQLYIPDTNVLITRFLSPDGVAELTDFMPVEEMYGGKELVRRVTCIQGAFTFQMTCCPRFDYARTPHKARQEGPFEIIFNTAEDEGISVRLKSTVPMTLSGDDAVATFTLGKGQKADFLLEHIDCSSAATDNLEDFTTQSLFDTMAYWKSWVEKSNYHGRWRETVNRSALCLKLMTSYQYGSIVASPTFGLPEEIGGERNWDYRYTWIRDASFTVYTLLKLGYRREAREFITG